MSQPSKLKTPSSAHFYLFGVIQINLHRSSHTSGSWLCEVPPQLSARRSSLRPHKWTSWGLFVFNLLWEEQPGGSPAGLVFQLSSLRNGSPPSSLSGSFWAIRLSFHRQGLKSLVQNPCVGVIPEYFLWNNTALTIRKESLILFAIEYSWFEIGKLPS